MATPSSAASQGPVLCRPTNNVPTSFKNMSNIVCGPAQDRPCVRQTWQLSAFETWKKCLMDKHLTWLVGWGRRRRTRRRGKVRDWTLKQTSSSKTDMQPQRRCGLHFNCRVIHNVPQVESVLKKPIPIVSFVKKSYWKNGEHKYIRTEGQHKIMVGSKLSGVKIIDHKVRKRGTIRKKRTKLETDEKL